MLGRMKIIVVGDFEYHSSCCLEIHTIFIFSVQIVMAKV